VRYFNDAVFAAMRAIDADAQNRLRRSRELSPRYGEIAVGGAHMDYFIPGEALSEFLRGLRKGAHPDAAVAAAKVYAREMVARWNKHRGGDYQTHLSEGCADTTIDQAWRRVLAVIPVEAALPPPPY
jgi:hypothetical protein